MGGLLFLTQLVFNDFIAALDDSPLPPAFFVILFRSGRQQNTKLNISSQQGH